MMDFLLKAHSMPSIVVVVVQIVDDNDFDNMHFQFRFNSSADCGSPVIEWTLQMNSTKWVMMSSGFGSNVVVNDKEETALEQNGNCFNCSHKRQLTRIIGKSRFANGCGLNPYNGLIASQRIGFLLAPFGFVCGYPSVLNQWRWHVISSCILTKEGIGINLRSILLAYWRFVPEIVIKLKSN